MWLHLGFFFYFKQVMTHVFEDKAIVTINNLPIACKTLSQSLQLPTQGAQTISSSTTENNLVLVL
jgi:hypothetical protein